MLNWKNYALLFCCLVFSYVARPQVIDAQICTETSRPVVTGYVSILKARTPIPFDSVRNQQNRARFTQLENKPVIYAGYDPYLYWFRFVISNTDEIPKNLVLLLGPTGMRDAALYQGGSGAWKMLGRTGNQYPFLERPYTYAHYAYPVTINGSSQDTFYLYMDQMHDIKAYGFALLHPKAMMAMKNRVYFYFGIIVGLMGLFFFLNVYLFFSIRERIHLWYALYIGALTLLVFENDQLDEQFLGFDSEQANRLWSLMVLGGLAITILTHVVQLFLLQVMPKKHWMYQVTRILKWNAALSVMVNFIIFYRTAPLVWEKNAFAWANASVSACIIAIIVNCVYSIYKGYKPALLILAGLFGFLTGAFEKLLLIPTPSYLFPPSTFHIGIILEVMIMSFGLIYRYRLDRKEKQVLFSTLQDQKIEEGIHVIAAQEEERKRIAEELHDELGSNLAAIKINLENTGTSQPLTPEQREKLVTLIDKASSDTRRIAHDLMPAEFANLQLGALVRSYFNQLGKDTKPVFEVVISGEQDVFSKEEKLFIYRIVLELTHNIITHAAASEATVQLIYYDRYLELMVEDNGIGFPAHARDGIGLRNIRSRVSYMQGQLTIDSSVRGTTISIILPYPQKQEL